MQRSLIILAFPVHIRALGYKEFDDFLATVYNRAKQGSPRLAAFNILHIDICTSIQASLDSFSIPFDRSVQQYAIGCRTSRVPPQINSAISPGPFAQWSFISIFWRAKSILKSFY